MVALFYHKNIYLSLSTIVTYRNTPYTSDVENVISVAAKLNSMIKILNYKLRKKKYSQISVGIGIDYGRALMVKAGYSGSGINDVIWMGDVVN